LGRKRIYEIARELGITSKELIAKLAEMGMPGLKAANSVGEDEYLLIINLYKEESAPPREEKPKEAAEPKEEAPPAPKKEKEGAPRPPVVSVLGHIDHGKTTLLDAIRHSHLAEKEVGGITQGIAAYQADLNGRRITFIDTPGHKAFTGMRARGAQATDIAVLVVAADDGVMAQTVEAIDHIKAAGVPMVVAINKIDKPNADVDKVMNDLVRQGLTPEGWGGDTITVEVSALQGKNIDELLEMILLVAEMEDLRADPDGPLSAVIIESHISSGQGPVASAVVKNGTLREKDWIVAGAAHGRVRALIDDRGNRVKEARPGDAVGVLGFNRVPPVGTEIYVARDQTEARRLAEGHEREESRPRRTVRRPTSFEELFEAGEETEKVRLILKGATSGALEAARREIAAIDVEGVEVEILHAGVGVISESDVLLAASVSDKCPVVGFGVKADGKARKLADREGISILTYDVIYDLIDEMERVLKGKLAPEYAEVEIGVAEVKDTFKVPTGVVAGCSISEGKAVRGSGVRVLRDGETVFVGEIASLRRFEDDVREVLAGRECGIRIKGFDDVKVGDRLSIFELKEIAR